MKNDSVFFLFFFLGEIKKIFTDFIFIKLKNAL